MKPLSVFTLRLLLSLLLVGEASAVTPAEWGQQLGLSAGQLLVASPRMGDPRFARSVVLLVDYGANGARGVIINRPTDSDLSADFGDRVRADVAAAPLYDGGPLGREHRLMLANFGTLDGGSFEVVEGLYFVHGQRLMRGLAEVPHEGAEYRVFAGYAGWARLQLEHEVARGDWFVVPASLHYVLELEPQRLWGELMRYYEAQMAALWLPSISALADG